MAETLTIRLARYLGCQTKAFAEDSEGVSLVEFAFMMPIMVLVLFMTISLSHMMMIDRKVTLTAQAAADLVAQRQDVDQDAIIEIQRAAELMMQPFATDFDISVAHVPYDVPSGTPNMSSSLAWKALINSGAAEIEDVEAEQAAAGNTISAPTGALVGPLGGPGDALIMLRMNYRYQSLWLSDFSLLGVNIPATLTFSKETYARPRLIRQIASAVPLYTVN